LATYEFCASMNRQNQKAAPHMHGNRGTKIGGLAANINAFRSLRAAAPSK
jgi:hypothetical protein